MTYPTINGTNKNELLDSTLHAADTINTAIRALIGAAPDARDYYVQGEGTYGRARAEHVARLDKLQDVLAELSDLAEHISDS